MYPVINLDKKNILIFGASKGIGQACAKVCDRLDAQVILSARDIRGLNNTKSMLNRNAHIYDYDLTNTEGIESLISQIVTECGKLDGIIYCSGVTDNRPLAMQKPEFVNNLFKVNFMSYMETVRCFAKKANHNECSSVVGIASVASELGTKAHEAYAASKGAMIAASKSMASELHTKGIRVNCVSPGTTRTEMIEEYLSNCENTGSDVGNRLLERQYLGMIEPEYIGYAVAFLLSDASKFVTGFNLPVDGGLLSV
ncbi:MAG: SDR family oxidoreductase [Lachnospiraceae bacterium]|nr:SDR family oxidoreductase [Lachnospiraceae bacterium]